MSELSNVVTVLIARMESHPDDFDMSAIDRPRFGHLAPYLTKLAGGGDELRERHAHAYVEEPFWFLSETDQQALVDAWKQYHYKTFEKRTMEIIFDEDYYTRQQDKYAQMQNMRNQMMQSTGTFASPLAVYGTGAQNAAQGMTISANGAVNMANTLSLGGETIDSGILKKLKDLVK